MAATYIPLPGFNTSSRARSRRKAIASEARAPESWTLFENLRQVRRRLAQEQRIKPKAVLPDKALMQMVRLRPTGTDELARVYGIGKVKLQRYGWAFLEVLQAFENGHGHSRAA